MALESSGLYNRQFQEKMIAHLLRCRRLLNFLAAGRITREDFSLPIHQAILNAAREVLQLLPEPGEFMPLTALMVPLQAMISARIVLPEEINALRESLQNIYTMELAPTHYEYILPEFLAEQRTLRAIKRGNIMDLPSLRADIDLAITSSRFNSGVTLKPLLNIKLAPPEVPVPCNINSIDQYMHGGLGLTRGMLICGFTGIGKTTLAINNAFGSAIQGYHACMVQTELPEDEMNFRLYSRAARCSYDMLQYDGAEHDELDAEMGLVSGPTRDEIEQQLIQKINIPHYLLNNYSLLDYSKRICTVQSIQDDLHRIQDAEPDNPPMVIDLDWLECVDLPPSNNRQKQVQSIPIKEMRHKLEKNSEDLNRLFVTENIAGRVYTQSDFAAEDQAVVKMSNKSEGKGASRRYSWFLGIGATRADLENDILTVTAGKSRNGRLFSCKIRRALHEQRFEDLEAQAEQAEVAAAQQELESDPFSLAHT